MVKGIVLLCTLLCSVQYRISAEGVSLDKESLVSAVSSIPEFDYDLTLTVQAQDANVVIQSKALTVDPNGGVYWSGLFQGTVDFDPSSETDFVTAPSSMAVFVGKFDPDMNYLWTVALPTQWESTSHKIPLDKQGNLYVAHDSEVTKISPDGTVSWTRQFKNGASFLYINDLCFDKDDNFFMAGIFKGTNDFDPTDEVDAYTTQDNAYIYITKLNQDGTYAWTRTYGKQNANLKVSVLTTNSQGHVITAGHFRGPGKVAFDPANPAESSGDWDIFILDLDPNGIFQWYQRIGGSDWDVLFDLCTDTDDNLYLTGGYSLLVDFNPDGGEDYFWTETPKTGECFLTQLTPEGRYGWTRTITPSSSKTRTAGVTVKTDAQDNLLILTECTAQPPYTKSPTSDLLLTVFNTQGVCLQQASLLNLVNTTLQDNYTYVAFIPWTWPMALTTSGDLLIAGQFMGNPDMNPFSASDVHWCVGGCDGFLMRLLDTSGVTLP